MAVSTPTAGLSRRAERTIRGLSTAAVLTLAIAAAILSFSGLQTLALEAGFPPSLAWLLPVVIDGMVLTGSLGVVASNLVGISTWYPWSLTILGVLASIAGNVVAAPEDLTSRLVHAAGPLAFALSIEGMLRIYRASAIASAQRELARMSPQPVVIQETRVAEPAPSPPVSGQAIEDNRTPEQGNDEATPETAKSNGLTARERIVAALEDYPDASAGEIARLLGTDPSYTRKIVRSLRDQDNTENANVTEPVTLEKEAGTSSLEERLSSEESNYSTPTPSSHLPN